MIAEASIEALKARIDIVDVIGGYIDLKKTGTNTYKACCPFHTEKSASFTVSGSKQIYHCFGCKASGDAIKFVQEHERLTYPEAMDKLAGIYGIALEHTQSQKKSTDVFFRMFTCFVSKLDSSHKEYLAQRGVSIEMIEKFGIGYAPSSKEQIEYAKSNILNIEELVEAGIFGNENSLFARFVDRIIFPIRNANGVFIGFGGRTISNHPAKYINSPQTEYFNKSKVFYALDLARDSIIRTGKMIIVEGYMDTIMLHQYGYTNTVAVLGTALTAEHIPTIKKLRCSVTLALDSDKAGIVAAIKSAQILIGNGIFCNVALFDSGKDPADMLHDGKLEAVQNIFDNPRAVGKFLIDQIATKYDIKDPMQKQVAFDEITEIIKPFPVVIQHEYTLYASHVLQVNAALFTTKAKKTETIDYIKSTADLIEASICLTMIERPETVEFIGSTLVPEVFTVCQALYLSAQNGEQIPSIMVDDRLKVLDDEQLRMSIKGLLTKYLDRCFFLGHSFSRGDILAAKAKLEQGDLSCLDMLLYSGGNA